MRPRFPSPLLPLPVTIPRAPAARSSTRARSPSRPARSPRPIPSVHPPEFARKLAQQFTTTRLRQLEPVERGFQIGEQRARGSRQYEPRSLAGLVRKPAITAGPRRLQRMLQQIASRCAAIRRRASSARILASRPSIRIAETLAQTFGIVAFGRQIPYQHGGVLGTDRHAGCQNSIPGPGRADFPVSAVPSGARYRH